MSTSANDARRECTWRSADGRVPKAPMTHAQAQEAVIRIFMLTRRYYRPIRCRLCGHWHIRKLSKRVAEGLRAKGLGPC